MPTRQELKARFDKINAFADAWTTLLVALQEARLADEGITLDASQVKTLTTGIRGLVEAKRLAEKPDG